MSRSGANIILSNRTPATESLSSSPRHYAFHSLRESAERPADPCTGSDSFVAVRVSRHCHAVITDSLPHLSQSAATAAKVTSKSSAGSELLNMLAAVIKSYKTTSDPSIVSPASLAACHLPERRAERKQRPSFCRREVSDEGSSFTLSPGNCATG